MTRISPDKSNPLLRQSIKKHRKSEGFPTCKAIIPVLQSGPQPNNQLFFQSCHSILASKNPAALAPNAVFSSVSSVLSYSKSAVNGKKDKALSVFLKPSLSPESSGSRRKFPTALQLFSFVRHCASGPVSFLLPRSFLCIRRFKTHESKHS